MNVKDQKMSFTKDEEVVDLGLTSKVTSNQRVINPDGSFNIIRSGLGFLKSFSVYHWLISMSWKKFCLIILVAYLVINLFFATLYYIGGDENFEGIETSNNFDKFLNEFFFQYTDIYDSWLWKSKPSWSLFKYRFINRVTCRTSFACIGNGFVVWKICKAAGEDHLQ
jgi:hypothetical protein